MEHNKLFQVLVLGGSSLTIGVGCSSSTSGGVTPPGSDATPAVTDSATSADTKTSSDSSSKTDGASRDETSIDDTGSSADTGDADPATCPSRCKWDGGIPFCDGVCCIWNAAHDCCDAFVKDDAGK